MKKILCQLGFHKWDYIKWTHYKYRGPTIEFAKQCLRCGKFINISPWSHEKHRWEQRSREIASKSSC